MPTKRNSGPFDVPLTELVSKKLTTISSDRTVGELNRLFDQPANAYVVVVDRRGRALGVVSRAEHTLWPPASPNAPLAELVSAGVEEVTGDMMLAAATALMVRRRLDGLLIAIDGGHAFVGGVDVVRWVAERSRRRS
ncbi:MAG: CBS domain-containing protein [Myxococcaceae bacterium]|nr:CBS domain-containing protein [Myxococcaceae bacterium]